MKFWKKMERYKNAKGEICLHTDLQLDEEEELKIILGNVEHIEKVPKGKYHKIHLVVAMQPYKTKKK